MEEFCNIQKIVMRVMGSLNYANFRLPRCGGKSFLLSRYALDYADKFNNSRIVITAPSLRQIKRVFSYELKIDTSVPKKVLDDSVIEGVEVSNVVNYSGDVLLIDEGNHISGDFLKQLLLSIEGQSFKKIFIMSTGFYDFNPMMLVEKNENFSSLAFGFKSYPKRIYNEQNILEARKILSAAEFDMEYNSKIIKINE